MIRSIFRIFLLLSIPSLSGHANDVVVVSDIDDTLLITHVEKPLAAVVNTFRRSRSYGGMPELIQAFGETATLHYVSGSGKFLEPKLDRFIESYGYPKGRLHLIKTKDWVRGRTRTFKLDTIGRLLENARTRRIPVSFIFIGDNTQHDPEIYGELRKLYPDLVSAIYIHQVSPRNPMVYEGVSYLTAVEVSILELMRGRISMAAAHETIEAFFNFTKDSIGFELLFPKWAFCPTTFRELPQILQDAYSSKQEGPFLQERRTAAARILKSCALRAFGFFSPEKFAVENELLFPVEE